MNILGNLVDGSSATSAEDEALQTDVMRFLAIVALCLLAVFAAVSGQPSADVSEQLSSQSASLAEMSEELVETQQNLAAQLEAIEQREREVSELIEQHAQLEQAKQQADQDLEALRERLQTTIEQAATQQAFMAAQLKKEVQDTQKLQQQNSQLLALKQALETETQFLREQLQQTPEPAVEQPMDPAQAEIAEPVPEPTPEPEPEPQPTEQKPPQLRFSSDRALMTLVSKKRVTLYTVAGGGVWEYTPEKADFERVESADQIYQINAVPNAIFSLAVRISNNQSPGFAVAMDAGLLDKIQQQLSTGSGGILEIQSDGEVRLLE